MHECREKNTKYKQSYYNYLYKTDKECLLFNSLSGSFMKFKEENISMLENALSFQRGNNKLMDMLINKGFIVDSQVDENDKLNKLENETKENRDILQIILLPTEKCNFRCKYCYQDYDKPQMNEEIINKLIEFVSENVINCKVLEVVWFGGEPILAIDIIEKVSAKLLNVCEKNRKIYTSTIITNGYKLDLKTFKILQKARVSNFQITLDGLESTHDKQRVNNKGTGSFKTIINNLCAIRDNIKTSTIKINIRTNLSKPILENIDEYLFFLKKEFSNDKRFTYLWRVAGDWHNMNDKSFKQQFIDINEYIDVIKLAGDNFLSSDILQNMFKPGGMVCYATKKNSYVIGSDGIIHKCTCNLDIEDNDLGLITHKEIDANKMNRWVENNFNYTKCHKCKERPICQTKACILNLDKSKEPKCPEDLKYIEEIMKSILIKQIDYYEMEE